MNTCNKLQHIIDNRTVSDWPVSKNVSDYDDVRKAYISALNVPIKAVYQVGSVSAPGVSDLDLFVVLDDADSASFKDFSSSLLNEEQRYIMIHEPWVVNESVFSKLGKVFPSFDLVRVHGATLNSNTLGRGNISIEDAFIFLSEYSITKIPRSLVDMLHDVAPMSARFAIVLINSLRHSINLYYIAGGESVSEWDLFIDEFDRFRRIEFTRDGAEEVELKQYFYQAIIISYQLIEKVNELSMGFFVSGHKHVFHDNSLGGYFSAKFIKNWSMDQALYEAIYRYRHGSNWLLLPASFQAYWVMVSRNNGALGRYISKILSHKPSCELTINDAIDSHVEAVNEYIEFSHQKLSYRGSIWITLGAGDSWFIRCGRLVNIYLKRMGLHR